MKFEEAFDKVYSKIPPEAIPKGNENYPKILAMLWSMLAISENVLDDIAFIDENKKIISIPVQKSPAPKSEDQDKPKDKKPKKGKGKGKKKKDSTPDDTGKDINGEKASQETTESTGAAES